MIDEHDDEHDGNERPADSGMPRRARSGHGRRVRPRLRGDEPTVVEDAPAAPTDQRDLMSYPGGLTRLADRYRLEEPIASGGAAVVWRAFDEVLSRTVAIKLLHPHLAGDPRTVERFRMESVNAARLTHPNVVAIYDTGQERDVVYLVMEHVEGPSLRDVLHDAGGEGLDPEVVAALGEQVADALGEAHDAGLVHRDVKPANILLTADGVAKVTDFGIAKALSGDTSTMTSPGTLVGTAAYIAPEQIDGEHEVDPRSDVYALGVVLHECLTGGRAFHGDTPAATAAARLERELLPPRQIRADVPRVLDDVVVRATRRDPRERYRDGTELARALAATVRARPTDATAMLVSGDRRPARHAPLGDRPPARLGVRLLAAFGGGLAVALVLVAALARGGDDGVPGEGPTEALFAVADFDPYGDGEEDPDGLALLRDGDPGTAWSTATYRAPLATVGLPGVGVWFDLGEDREVAQVRLDGLTPGSAVEIAVRDEPPALGDTEQDWEPVVRDASTGVREAYVLDEAVTSRWWLVWFSELGPVGEDWVARLGDVRFDRVGAAAAG